MSEQIQTILKLTFLSKPFFFVGITILVEQYQLHLRKGL